MYSDAGAIRAGAHAHVTLTAVPAVQARPHCCSPEHAVGAAREVRILNERHILSAGERDRDLTAKGLERLSAFVCMKLFV